MVTPAPRAAIVAIATAAALTVPTAANAGGDPEAKCAHPHTIRQAVECAQLQPGQVQVFDLGAPLVAMPKRAAHVHLKDDTPVTHDHGHPQVPNGRDLPRAGFLR